MRQNNKRDAFVPNVPVPVREMACVSRVLQRKEWRRQLRAAASPAGTKLDFTEEAATGALNMII